MTKRNDLPAASTGGTISRRTVAKAGLATMGSLVAMPHLARQAFAADKVTLRTNWLFYGSHAIFFLGIDKGFYEQNDLDVVVKQGNGSGNTVRLVANKDSTFAYVSAAALIKLWGYEAIFLFSGAASLLGGLVVFLIRSVR